jgi:ubiquitin-activating enzyme E1
MFEVSSGKCPCPSKSVTRVEAEPIRSVFNDFGGDFACVDATGENPQMGMIVHIEEVSHIYLSHNSVANRQSENALVTCLDETRHGLEDGDYVTFTEVKGMDINGKEPRKISTNGEFARKPAHMCTNQ